MAYTKQTWADLPSKTTPINAERLTHIEDGIFNAAATADNAASAAGTAAADVGIVSGKVETLTERVNGLDTAVGNKVDKVAGKGLSTKDYDNTDKGKVDALGTASTKNSTSVVTQSTDLVESGAVYDALGFGNKNLLNVEDGIYNLNNCAKQDDATRLRSTKILSLKAGAYVLSGTASKTLRYFYLIWQYGDKYGDNIKLFNSSWVNVNEPFTLDTDSYVTIGIGYTDNTNIDSSEVIVQLEKGNTATAYEPYHENVVDTLRDAEVIEGKNLLNPDNLGHNTYNSSTGAYESTNPSFSSTTDFVEVESGATYCISKDGVMAETRKFYYTADGTFISSEYNTSAFTIPSNARKFKFHTGNYSGSLTGWQMEKGSTATPYEPYYIPLKDVVPNKCDNSVIGTVEDGVNPTKSYAVGEHFIRNGKFCTVTVAVTTSSTWTLGSNYVEGTIADNLIKKATFSGTTNANGNLLVTSSFANKELINISSAGNSQIILPFKIDNSLYIHLTNTEVQALSNTAVSGTYYYID